MVSQACWSTSASASGGNAAAATYGRTTRPGSNGGLEGAEPVDVDEREHELRAQAMRALELVRDLGKTERPCPRTGQFVSRR